MAEINFKEELAAPLFQSVNACAASLGIRVFVVGGWVRDHLIGRPSKDVDLVVEGDGISFARSLAKWEGANRKVTVYTRFGTAMMHFDDFQVEIVGARKESYRAQSRKPLVVPGTLEEDQLRRDFTINSMSFGLNDDDFGNLIDPFGGLQDLNQRIIRTPDDPLRTFSEDPLRMMRAIRFATQLDYAIEERTFSAIEENKDRMEIISMERITGELNKIILSDHPSRGFYLMDESGLLPIVFPEFSNLKGIEIRNGISHKDNFKHTLEVLDNVSALSESLWLRWAAILHDIAKPLTKRFEPGSGWTFHGHEDMGARMVPKLFSRFRLPLDSKMKYVRKLVRLHLRPIALTNDKISDSGVRRLLFDAGDDLEDLMFLAEADITSKNHKRVRRYQNNFKRVRILLNEIEEKDRLRNWQPPVSGQLIMDTFGLGPCKKVGAIKSAIREAILEGEIGNNKEEAHRFMLLKGKEMGLLPLDKNE